MLTPARSGCNSPTRAQVVKYVTGTKKLAQCIGTISKLKIRDLVQQTVPTKKPGVSGHASHGSLLRDSDKGSAPPVSSKGPASQDSSNSKATADDSRSASAGPAPPQSRTAIQGYCQAPRENRTIDPDRVYRSRDARQTFRTTSPSYSQPAGAVVEFCPVLSTCATDAAQRHPQRTRLRCVGGDDSSGPC